MGSGLAMPLFLINFDSDFTKKYYCHKNRPPDKMLKS